MFYILQERFGCKSGMTKQDFKVKQFRKNTDL